MVFSQIAQYALQDLLAQIKKGPDRRKGKMLRRGLNREGLNRVGRIFIHLVSEDDKNSRMRYDDVFFSFKFYFNA